MNLAFINNNNSTNNNIIKMDKQINNIHVYNYIEYKGHACDNSTNE